MKSKKLLLLLLLAFCAPWVAMGQNPVYTKVTSMADISVDDTYILVYEGSGGQGRVALSNPASTFTSIPSDNISISDGKITGTLNSSVALLTFGFEGNELTTKIKDQNTKCIWFMDNDLSWYAERYLHTTPSGPISETATQWSISFALNTATISTVVNGQTYYIDYNTTTQNFTPSSVASTHIALYKQNPEGYDGVLRYYRRATISDMADGNRCILVNVNDATVAQTYEYENERISMLGTTITTDGRIYEQELPTNTAILTIGTTSGESEINLRNQFNRYFSGNAIVDNSNVYSGLGWATSPCYWDQANYDDNGTTVVKLSRTISNVPQIGTEGYYDPNTGLFVYTNVNVSTTGSRNFYISYSSDEVIQGAGSIGFRFLAYGSPLVNSAVPFVEVEEQKQCSAPTNLVATNVTNTSATLSWTANSQESSWTIYLVDVDNVQPPINQANVTTNPLIVTNLAPNTTYRFTVQSNCSDYDTSMSDYYEFTTYCAATPTNLTVSNITTNSASLSWTGDEDALAWQVCVNNDESNLYNVSQNPVKLLENLSAGTTYNVKVRAVCPVGGTHGLPTYSAWSEPVSFTTYCLEAPVLTVDASSITSTSAELSWTGTDTNPFSWQICVNGDMQNLLDVANTSSMNPAAPTYVLGSLSSGTTYRVKVRTVCTVTVQPGHTLVPSTYSDWSNEVSFTTNSDSNDCQAPTSLTATNITNTSVELSWTKNGTSFQSWQICIDNNENNLINTAQNPHVLTNLEADHFYSVKVRAVCLAYQHGSLVETGHTDWSNEVSFRTFCTEAPVLTIDNITNNSADLSWDDDNNAGWGWQICINGDTDNLTAVSSLDYSDPYTLDGLNAGTTYTVKVRAVCSVSAQHGQAVLTTSDWSNEVSFRTFCTEAPVLTYSNVTSASVDLSWNDDNNAGWGWQICINGDTDNLTAVSRLDYSDPYTLDGLNAGTTYTVKVRAVCSVSAQAGQAVLTTSDWSNEVSFRTFCTEAPVLTYSNVTSASVDLSWANDNDAHAGWQICINGDTDNLTAVNSLDYSDPYTLDGLNAGTTYTVKVRAVCSVSAQAGQAVLTTSDWSNEVSFTTTSQGGQSCVTYSYQKVTSLGDIDTNASYILVDDSWTNPFVALYDEDSEGDPIALDVLRVGTGVPIPVSALLTGTAIFTLESDANNTGYYTLKTPRENGSYSYLNGDHTNVDGSHVEFGDYVSTTNDSFDSRWGIRADDEGVFLTKRNNKYNLAYDYDANDDEFLNLDASQDYLVYLYKLVATIEAPTNFVVVNVNSSMALLGWSNDCDASEWEVVYSDVPDFDPDGATPIERDNDIVYLRNLDAGVTYYVYVRTVEGANHSAWTGPVSFTTSCSTVTVGVGNPFTEDFDDSSDLPECWTVGAPVNVPTPINWAISDENHTENGSHGVYSGNTGDIEVVNLYTPLIQFENGVTAAELTFWYKNQVYVSFYDEGGYPLSTIINMNMVPQYLDDEWHQVTIDLSSALVSPIAFKVGFSNGSYGGPIGGCYVDDVVIRATSSCDVFTVDESHSFFENFEGISFPPECWMVANDGSLGDGWTSSSQESHGGDKSAYSGDTYGSFLVSPMITISSDVSNPQLTFWHVKGDGTEVKLHTPTGDQYFQIPWEEYEPGVWVMETMDLVTLRLNLVARIHILTM